MTSPYFPLLLKAMALGSVRLRFGRVHGHSGYVDPQTRTVVLNPDADPEQLEAELGHDLAQLLEHDAACAGGDSAVGGSAELSLVHSADEPEIPAPRVPLDRRTIPDLRVLG